MTCRTLSLACCREGRNLNSQDCIVTYLNLLFGGFQFLFAHNYPVVLQYPSMGYNHWTNATFHFNIFTSGTKESLGVNQKFRLGLQCVAVFLWIPLLQGVTSCTIIFYLNIIAGPQALPL